MSLEHQRLVHAELSRQTVSKVRENFRSHLLMALSEAREVTLSLDHDLREKLLDGLSRHFNPDGSVSDLFSDAFTDAEMMAEQAVEDARDEFCLARRAAE